MEDEKISRAYLETLSFSDLVKLADEYGVDVPEDLDRRLLIGELLELSEENKHGEEQNMIISAGEGSCQDVNLPKSYNERFSFPVCKWPHQALVSPFQTLPLTFDPSSILPLLPAN